MNIVYLKEKRDECCAKLSQYTAKIYTKKFLSIYEQTKKNNKKPRMLLKEFQHAVRAISEWTDGEIKEEHNQFRSVYESFDGLVRSIFKVHLAIYNAAHESNFEACIPNAGQYMHETYLNIARMLWKEPFLLYDVNVPKQEYMKNMIRLEKITKRCMLDTFVFMLPFKEFDEQLAAESDSSDYLESDDVADSDADSDDVADEDDDDADDVADSDADDVVDDVADDVVDDVADSDADDVADEVADSDADEVADNVEVVEEDEIVESEDEVVEEQPETAKVPDEVIDKMPCVIDDTSVGGIDKLIELPSCDIVEPVRESNDLCTPLTKSIDLSADEEEEEPNVEVPLDDPDLRVVTIVETPQRRTLSERKKLVKEIVKKRGFPDFAKPKDSFF